MLIQLTVAKNNHKKKQTPFWIDKVQWIKVVFLHLSYQFPGVVVSNLTKLEATIANLATKKEDLNVKVSN